MEKYTDFAVKFRMIDFNTFCRSKLIEKIRSIQYVITKKIGTQSNLYFIRDKFDKRIENFLGMFLYLIFFFGVLCNSKGIVSCMCVCIEKKNF